MKDQASKLREMVAGHTPGPWKHGGCVVWGSDGDLVCDLAMRGGHRTPNETEANARLIAASPDLLDALKVAAPWIGRAIDEGAYDKCVLPDAPGIALQQIEAAIAKAI